MNTTKALISPKALDKVYVLFSNGQSVRGIVQLWGVSKDNVIWAVIQDLEGSVVNVNLNHITAFTVEQSSQSEVKVVFEPEIVPDVKGKTEEERIEEYVKVNKEKTSLTRVMIKNHMKKPLQQITLPYIEQEELVKDIK